MQLLSYVIGWPSGRRRSSSSARASSGPKVLFLRSADLELRDAANVTSKTRSMREPHGTSRSGGPDELALSSVSKSKFLNFFWLYAEAQLAVRTQRLHGGARNGVAGRRERQFCRSTWPDPKSTMAVTMVTVPTSSSDAMIAPARVRALHTL